MDVSAWNERYASTELVWSDQPNVFVAAALTDHAPGRALDLATGEGRNAVWLAGRDWRVTAVDFSPVALDKGRHLAAQRNVSERIDWIEADLTRWRPEPGSYDAIVVAYLHLAADALAGVLGGAAAGLAPGGTLVVVGHDRDNLTGGCGGPQDPAILYRPEEIAAVLAEAGLRCARAETVERPTPDGVALDTLVIAARPA